MTFVLLCALGCIIRPRLRLCCLEAGVWGREHSRQSGSFSPLWEDLVLLMAFLGNCGWSSTNTKYTITYHFQPLSSLFLLTLFLSYWHYCKLLGFTPGQRGVRVRRADWAGSQLCAPSRPVQRTVCCLLLCQPVGRSCWSREFGYGDPDSFSSSIYRYMVFTVW